MIGDLLPLMSSLQLLATVNPFKPVIGLKTISIKLDVFGPAALEGSPALDFLRPIGPTFAEKAAKKSYEEGIIAARSAKLGKAEAKAQLARVEREEDEERAQEEELVRLARPESKSRSLSPAKTKDRSKKVKKESGSDDEAMLAVPDEFENSERDAPSGPAKYHPSPVKMAKKNESDQDDKPLIERLRPVDVEEYSEDEIILKKVQARNMSRNAVDVDDGEYRKIEGDFTFDVRRFLPNSLA